MVVTIVCATQWFRLSPPRCQEVRTLGQNWPVAKNSAGGSDGRTLTSPTRRRGSPSSSPGSFAPPVGVALPELVAGGFVQEIALGTPVCMLRVCATADAWP